MAQNIIIHRSDTRGQADYGWLQARYSFSFAGYRNLERMHFGALRVLNDDLILGGKGFGEHPHDNMEIITIPLSGALEHRDSMGNASVIKAGDIQVMSAGTGIRHSEFNHYPDKAINLLQIWIFPNQENVKPRYDQITLNPKERSNRFQQIISPSPNDNGVWIHQNAWLHLGTFDIKINQEYKLNNINNGVYVFVIKGEVEVEKVHLKTRDALGVWDIDRLNLNILEGQTEILLIEVPMQF